MKRFSLSVLAGTLLLLAASSAIAQSAATASHMTTKTVTFKSGDDMASGVLFTPAAKGNTKLPAIVVIQEWWGLNDWVKKQAEDLASQGYETLAVDLYRGKIAKTRDEAHELMSGLSP